MKDNDLIREALDTEAGSAPSQPAWDGIRHRSGALQRRRWALRAAGGGTLVAGAVAIALLTTGVIGNDEENGDVLTAIAFPRIVGGKHFDVTVPWFGELLASIGQPLVPAAHG